MKVKKMPLLILNGNEDTPLTIASFLGHTNMISYLRSLNSNALECLTTAKRTSLPRHTIYNDMYGKPYILYYNFCLI